MKPTAGWVKGLLKYLVAVALLAFVIAMNWTDLNVLFSRDPQPIYFAATLGLMVVVIGLQYLRWFLLVRALDLPFTLGYGLRLGMVGTFYNMFLPGGIGGDFVKAYLIAKGQPARQAAAVSTVIADRLLGLFGLLLYVAVVGGLCWADGDARIAASFWLKFIITACVALATGFVVGYAFLNAVPAQFGERLRRYKVSLGEMWDAARRYRQRPTTILTCVAVSAVAHLGLVMSFHFAVLAFPPEDPALIATLPELFVIAPIGYITQALLPFPGGIGAAELTFKGLYILLRGEAGGPVGVAGRLTLRVAEWVIGFAAYIAYLRTKSEIPADAEVTAAEPAAVA